MNNLYICINVFAMWFVNKNISKTKKQKLHYPLENALCTSPLLGHCYCRSDNFCVFKFLRMFDFETFHEV